MLITALKQFKHQKNFVTQKSIKLAEKIVVVKAT